MNEIKVPKMNCQGCVNRITEELSTGGFEFEVVLETKVVKVAEPNVKAAKKLIKKAGFKPE